MRETRRSRWGRELAVAAVGQLSLLAVLTAAPGLGPVGWAAGVGAGCAVLALLAAGLHRSGAPRLGPANRVTLLRSVLTGGVAALVAEALAAADRAPLSAEPVPGGAVGAVVAGLAAVALVLDAVDGRVARRTASATPLGARFDVEVDAFLVAVLSVHVAASLGPWVLAIGAMRYVFVAASLPLPWLRAPLRDCRARKVVGALQGAVLVAVTTGLLPHGVALGAVAAALAALAWSFGRDVAALAVRRGRTRGSVAATSPRR